MRKTSSSKSTDVLMPRIETRIQVVRGLKVMIDADLAELYGVPTKALNQAVKRNAARFPADFVFQLSAAEKAKVVTDCDHLAKLKFSSSLPFAFTEYGAVALANVLASHQAVEMGIYVVRAFVRLREVAGLHADLAKRLDELEDRSSRLELSHDSFSNDTRTQMRHLLEAVRGLMAPPDPPSRPIGFVAPQEKKKPSAPAKSARRSAGR